MRLGQQLYPKAEKCRLLSRAPSEVAQDKASTAQSTEETEARATASGQSSGVEWHLVWVVDGLPMEGGA
jgi:hypothetical protein